MTSEESLSHRLEIAKTLHKWTEEDIAKIITEVKALETSKAEHDKELLLKFDSSMSRRFKELKRLDEAKVGGELLYSAPDFRDGSECAYLVAFSDLQNIIEGKPIVYMEEKLIDSSKKESKS